MTLAVAEEHINNMKRSLALSRSHVMDSHSAIVGDSLNFDELIDRLKTAEKHAADAVVAGRCADSLLPLSIRSDVQKFQHGVSVSNMPNMFSESKRAVACNSLTAAQETALQLLNESALQCLPCANPSHVLPRSHMLAAGVFADVSLRNDARSLDNNQLNAPLHEALQKAQACVIMRLLHERHPGGFPISACASARIA